MDKLIQRIRGVTHLLLIWGLLLCWVASIEPVDIHRLCLDLEINWNQHFAAMRNCGTVPELSLARPAEFGLRGVDLETEKSMSLHHQTLSRLRYANLSEDSGEQAGVSAERYLEECEQTLRTIAEAARSGEPAFSTETMTSLYAKIESQVALLRWHIERLELPPTATLVDVAQEARPKIMIPGSGQSIPMTSGVAVSLIGLTFVYLYLVSLLNALRLELCRVGMNEVCEWVFLHPGWLGSSLGFLWLTFPLAALWAAGASVFSVQSVRSVSEIAVYSAPLLPLACLWSCISAMRVRIAVRRRPRTLTIDTDHEEVQTLPVQYYRRSRTG